MANQKPKTVEASVDGQSCVLDWDSATGTYKGFMPAPVTSSYSQPNQYYPVVLSLVDDAGNTRRADDQDPEYGSKLRLHVNEQPPAYLLEMLRSAPKPVLYLLDDKFETIAVVDTYISLIWTERYSKCGDFELLLPLTDTVKNLFIKDRYLVRTDSEYVMIIENLETTYDAENGDTLKVSGRTAESIFERRIIWNIVTISGDLNAIVLKLLNENAISPSIEARRIPNVQYQPNEIATEIIDVQYFGEDLYASIEKLCDTQAIGFKMVLNNDTLVFSLYKGIDYSYNQTENDYVVFSHRFGNLISSNQIVSDKTLKNACLIIGEGEPATRKTASIGEYSGLLRREVFADGSSITQKTGEKDPETDEDILISDEDYTKLLEQYGKSELLKYLSSDSFDAELSYDSTFHYGTDYTVGDIVSVVSPYSENQRARVVEYIRSSDDSGSKDYPTFEILEGE